ncbi:hypothetical protein [Priestia koreensis]|uniref:Uncharacterized protein n=1 Tax=Priestia koreensis TaxID=284581 RepID=A0A0M0LNQ6_9BACI|nr:hypothetical protein [Priestia koreensis]KOO52715.1 hypothetical protein AMD01_00020 [Priestia koreensis]
MRLSEADQFVIEHYLEADTICSLTRKKANWSAVEKVTEAAIFLFTPFINGLEQANALSDLGMYYLIEQHGKQLLVRVPRLGKDHTIEETDVTGKFRGCSYVVGKDRFEKTRDLKKRSSNEPNL